MSIERLKVPVERLRRVCDPDSLGFEMSSEVAPLEGAIAQERAMSALELGLGIETDGFNIFVSGAPGTGRNTALQEYMERIAGHKSNPPDWGYLYNFQDPTQPIPVALPCGEMRVFARDMNELIETCRAEIPAAFDNDDYSHRIQQVMEEIQRARQAITQRIEGEARARGFTLSFTQVGITPVPLRPEGRGLTQEEFGQLPGEAQDEVRSGSEALQHTITHAMSEFRRLNKEAAALSRNVDVELVRFTLKPIIDELQDKYAEHRELVEYLDEMESDMVSNIQAFKPTGDGDKPQASGVVENSGDDFFTRYRVNDIVDNTLCDGAPIVFEHNPTYYNLFGRIDYRARMGLMATDHMMIKSGAIHRANGGYLVLQANDLLANPLSWDTLKRTLRSGEIRVENIGELNSAFPTSSMRPRPIPLNAKIILVGGAPILRLLRNTDPNFGRYFKVTAEFDTVMERTPQNVEKYAAFMSGQVSEKGLRIFDKTAVASIVDYSSRMTQDQEKLTTRFMRISDIMTEADYWSGKRGDDRVTSRHIEEAIQQRRYRASLVEDHIMESIEKDSVHISTEGCAVGQVNGLAVYFRGEHDFGRPSRITARVSVGRGQVVNVERESRMSGRIHNKGFMIIRGYLNGKYGGQRPLSISASLTFEQTYSSVDGDSASSTELYALLSALSEVPIRQGIAVTGSVNQTGEVQAIGGATHKIEGFFDVCKTKGITGEQGVIIPKANIRNLMLRSDLVEAVRDGAFRIYAVSSIDEGIEVLTGIEAGEKDEDGKYAEGTIHFMVERRLEVMSRRARSATRTSNQTGSDTEEIQNTEDVGEPE